MKTWGLARKAGHCQLSRDTVREEARLQRSRVLALGSVPLLIRRF